MESPLSCRLQVANLLLLSSYGLVKGLATISPPEVASVCSGHQLELLCSDTGSFLQWNFSLVHEGETTARLRMFTITSYSSHDQTQSLRVNSTTTFTFSRSSTQNVVPLVSTLSISTTSDGLNGTVVTCSDVETSESASTTIRIINENLINTTELEVVVLLEEFEGNGVNVTLEWTKENSLYSYNVSVSPQLEVMFTGKDRVQLKVPYNSLYNVSIAALPPCQHQTDIASTIDGLSLYYTKCRYPVATDEHIKIVGYRDPSVEGSNITFGCSTLELGFITSTCMVNGEWEPDPGETGLECNRMITSVNSSETVTLETLSQDGKIAVVSSVTVFTMTSILFFTVGFLCGYLLQKKKNMHTVAETVSWPIEIQVPYDAETVLDQELQLKDNIAYSPMQLSSRQPVPLYEDVQPSAVQHQLQNENL